jgi:hypothetical protein
MLVVCTMLPAGGSCLALRMLNIRPSRERVRGSDRAGQLTCTFANPTNSKTSFYTKHPAVLPSVPKKRSSSLLMSVRPASLRPSLSVLLLVGCS